MVPTIEALAAFWRIKNTGSLEPGETGVDRSDYAAYLAMVSTFLEQGEPDPYPESEAGLDDPNPRTPDSFYMGYGRGGV